MFVEVLLAEQPMAADRQAVVARERDDRVVELAEFFELFKNSPDVVIDGRDAGVVVVQMLANDGVGARPRGELLVADLQRADVERVMRQQVRRQRNFFAVVELHPFIGGDARVVWAFEFQAHQQRLLAIPFFLHELDRMIRHGSPVVVAGALALVVELLRKFERLVILGRHVAPFRFLIRHIARFAKNVTDRAFAFFRLVAIERHAAEHLMPRRVAHGRRGRAHAVGARERGAALHEAVEVRRLDHRVAERGDRVGPLVVGDEEQNVGAFFGRLNCRADGYHPNASNCKAKHQTAPRRKESTEYAVLRTQYDAQARPSIVTRRQRFQDTSPAPPRCGRIR